MVVVCSRTDLNRAALRTTSKSFLCAFEEGQSILFSSLHPLSDLAILSHLIIQLCISLGHSSAASYRHHFSLNTSTMPWPSVSRRRFLSLSDEDKQPSNGLTSGITSNLTVIPDDIIESIDDCSVLASRSMPAMSKSMPILLRMKLSGLFPSSSAVVSRDTFLLSLAHH